MQNGIDWESGKSTSVDRVSSIQCILNPIEASSVSAIEHPAVRNQPLWLKGQNFEVDFAPVDSRGFVDVEELRS